MGVVRPEAPYGGLWTAKLAEIWRGIALRSLVGESTEIMESVLDRQLVKGEMWSHLTSLASRQRSIGCVEVSAGSCLKPQ